MTTSTGAVEGGRLALAAEAKHVASSAVMHISILKSQLQFLQENNGLSKEVKDALASLVSQLPPKPEVECDRDPPATQTEILQLPRIYQATSDYIGPDIYHLIAKTGDTLEVQSWSGTKAAAYNTRTEKIGWIPRNLLILDKTYSTARITREVLVSQVAFPASSMRPLAGDMTWRAGEHIRVCKFDNGYRNQGTGFNMATGKFGRFHVGVGSLKTA